MKDSYGFSWEEFLERYLDNHEEFVFFYNNIKIEFVCEKNCYPIVVDFRNGKVAHYEYKNPQEALMNFRIERKTIKEIWEYLR